MINPFVEVVVVYVKSYNWSDPSLPPDPPISAPAGDALPPIPPILPPPPPPPAPPSPDTLSFPWSPAFNPSVLKICVVGLDPTPLKPPPPPPPAPLTTYSLYKLPSELNIFITEAPPPPPPAPDHPEGPGYPPLPPLYPNAFFPPKAKIVEPAPVAPLSPLYPGAICKTCPGETVIIPFTTLEGFPAAPA